LSLDERPVNSPVYR